MSNDKQTGVEWFADKIRNYKTPLNMGGVYFVLIHQEMINKYEQQAKEVEKQRIIDAHIDGQPLYSCQREKAEQYYNETYGGNK
jgi:hypothetical protein